MRAVILNGALPGDQTCAAVETELTSALAGLGWDADCLRLRDLTIAYCKGCFGCWVKTPGVCPPRDDAGLMCRALFSAQRFERVDASRPPGRQIARDER
jgi:multimeric flavodoxin WrbA